MFGFFFWFQASQTYACAIVLSRKKKQKQHRELLKKDSETRAHHRSESNMEIIQIYSFWQNVIHKY